MQTIVIAVDFDGTIVDHDFPNIGVPNPGAIETLLELQKTYRLILLTMRNGELLDNAVNYCRMNGVEFWAINENPEMNDGWSRKVHANIYIDDNGLGCPTIKYEGFNRIAVDWTGVNYLLKERGIL